MIALMWLMLRLFVSRDVRARRARARAAGRRRPPAPLGRDRGWAARPADLRAGVVGRRAQLPRRLADALQGDRHRLPARRLHRAARRRLLQRALPRGRAGRGPDDLGRPDRPVIAVLSFVCSVGNIPLAAVLWSGGISFAGVMAFIYADLIVLPIIARLPQVLRDELRAADHGADVRDDGARGARRSTCCSARSG